MNTPLTFVLLAMLSAIPRPGLSQAYNNETIAHLDDNGHPIQDTTAKVPFGLGAQLNSPLIRRQLEFP